MESNFAEKLGALRQAEEQKEFKTKQAETEKIAFKQKWESERDVRVKTLRAIQEIFAELLNLVKDNYLLGNGNLISSDPSNDEFIEVTLEWDKVNNSGARISLTTDLPYGNIHIKHGDSVVKLQTTLADQNWREKIQDQLLEILRDRSYSWGPHTYSPPLWEN
jgi:hypothetical protein